MLCKIVFISPSSSFGWSHFCWVITNSMEKKFAHQKIKKASSLLQLWCTNIRLIGYTVCILKLFIGFLINFEKLSFPESGSYNVIPNWSVLCLPDIAWLRAALRDLESSGNCKTLKQRHWHCWPSVNPTFTVRSSFSWNEQQPYGTQEEEVGTLERDPASYDLRWDGSVVEWVWNWLGYRPTSEDASLTPSWGTVSCPLEQNT